MINLIGPDRKKQILAARRNSIWVRYNFLLVSTLAAITIILGGTAFFYYGQKLSQDQSLQENNKKLKTKEYQDNKKKVDEFKKNLKTAKTVLDAETHYSDILLSVSKTMPPNTILKSIEFNAATFSSTKTVEFQSVTIDDALALKTAFQKNPPLSSKVHFSVITKINGADQGLTAIDSAYPTRITMFMELKKPTSAQGSSTTQGGVSR